MRKKICGIYTIEMMGVVIYVGQSIDMVSRFNNHKRKLRNNVHNNPWLQNKYNKYSDSFVFRLLEECSEDCLDGEEQFWVNMINPIANFRKITSSNKGLKYSDNTKSKMSLNMLGNTRGLGYKHTPEMIDYLKQVNQNRSPAYRSAISAALQKPVLCIDTGVIFKSAQAASFSFGFGKASISLAITRTQGRRGKYTFRYLTPEELKIYRNSTDKDPKGETL